MFYLILKFIFKVALRVFFRKIEVRNKHLIPRTGPLLIVANHPNTFMDPIAIASVVHQEVYFMAKSTVFSSPLTKWLLQRMNLIPVYRREDGILSDKANDKTFQKCYEFLGNKGTLLIFPEGTSFNERRLRPVKSGASRIALGTEDLQNFKAELLILPVGLNYSDAPRFQSTLFINIGAPIKVKDFEASYKRDAYRATQELTDTIKNNLMDLIVMTQTEEEDNLVKEIESIYKNDLVAALQLTNNQPDRLVLTKGIIDSIRYFYHTDEQRVHKLQLKVAAYHNQLEALGLRDKFIKPGQLTAGWAANAFFIFIYLTVGMPVYLYGAIINYAPYLFPRFIACKLTEEKEFRAPIMMTVGMVLFPIWYGILIFGFSSLSKATGLTFIFALSLPVSGFFALQYYYRLMETTGYLRFLNLFFNKKAKIKALVQKRLEIISFLEEAKDIYLNSVKAPAGN